MGGGLTCSAQSRASRARCSPSETCSAQSQASRAGWSPSESSSELEPLRCVQYRRVGGLRLRRLESRCECQTCQRACVCNSVSIGYVLLYSVLLLTRCLKMLYVAVGIR